MQVSPISFGSREYHLYTKSAGNDKKGVVVNKDVLEAEISNSFIARKLLVDAPAYTSLPKTKSMEGVGIKYTMHGEMADPRTNPITRKHLSELLGNFYRLDRAGIYHGHLGREHVFFDDNGRVEIDCFQYVNLFNVSGGKFSIASNRTEEPDFMMPSNASKFEEQTLSEYITKLSPREKHDFVKMYLEEKSDYNKERAKLLKSLNTDLNDKTAEYELAQANAFKVPSYDVVDYNIKKLELAKIKHDANALWHEGSGHIDGTVDPDKRFDAVILLFKSLNAAVDLAQEASNLALESDDEDEQAYFTFEAERNRFKMEDIYKTAVTRGAKNFNDTKFNGGEGLYLGCKADLDLFEEFCSEIDLNAPVLKLRGGINTVTEYYINLANDWTDEDNLKNKATFCPKTA